MTKIAIISDTHMPKRAKAFPTPLLSAFERCSRIIHAGDWTDMAVYFELKKWAPVDGVYGNVDPPETKNHFSATNLIEAEGYRIGIVHGHLGKKKSTPERALEAFQGEEPDIIIFGHSHTPYMKKHGNILLFNPGSPTDRRFQPNFSYGILEIGEEIKIQHHFYKEKN